ncbi:hypothetical protein ASPBRDRAFT_37926 [Aspergillus brasiliensis CBS 101740]|uniref:Uncharacterized protein n=1 Tax=Aspergillus brasiliensis (strain CBS 101740 / IMI 381727 / IBT 21946) TaxID=767769 RepID=A0A1L9UV85_ASPBC|nr:hypothetical protein ASPBRDRAFT_37926 [Aspergillus brasiliensis CBS 101740]
MRSHDSYFIIPPPFPAVLWFLLVGRALAWYFVYEGEGYMIFGEDGKAKEKDHTY